LVEIVSEKKKYKLVGMAKENFPLSRDAAHPGEHFPPSSWKT